MSLHLIPEESPFETAPVIAAYQVAVATALRLNEGTRKLPCAIAVCLPSFEPEWAIKVSGSLEAQYSLLYTTTSTSMWPYSRANDVQVTTHERRLESGIGESIYRIWTTLLNNVRHPDEFHAGLDGETYHFLWRAPYHPPLAGRTWSPLPDSVSGKLVALTQALRDYAIEDPQHDAQRFTAILRSIEWFRSMGSLCL